jgi:hypothetical protein
MEIAGNSTQTRRPRISRVELIIDFLMYGCRKMKFGGPIDDLKMSTVTYLQHVVDTYSVESLAPDSLASNVRRRTAGGL